MINRIGTALAVLFLWGSSALAATLLPNGMQYFTDSNGLPLSAGCVFFYVPGTLSPKTTYQDANQTISNTNPVLLDAAGRAIVFGTGTYRQIVRASNGTITPCSPAGTQIWDQLTASTDSSATIFAGPSAGTPNAITVNAPAFSGTDGQVINYISTNTNTAAATLNPSGFGAVPIVRDSATGPGALTGGELVATNAVSVIYDATAGTFHILSPVTWPNTSGVPVGTTIEVSGFTAPTNYAFAYGQEISRTTYSSLFAVLTAGQTGTISSGSPTITGLTDTTQFGRGMPVESVGINPGTTILSCTSTTCDMSSNATISRSGTMTFFAYSAGDGSTTFNLPDYRGMVLVARDNLGGTAANRVQVTTTLTTTATSTSATVASATGLQLGMVVTSANVVSGTTITAISGTTLTLSSPASGSAIGAGARFSPFADAQVLGVGTAVMSGTLVTANLPPYTPAGTNTAGAASYTFISASFQPGSNLVEGTSIAAGGGKASQFTNPTFGGTPQGGTSIPFSVIQPSRTVNRAIKLVP
ncbi:MAG: hypothetical protein K2Y05_05820 [Hyphomicrobiaceae bacterium]|nr:hypothetical protein [Hyphomicrobiaceae bacterium]